MTPTPVSTPSASFAAAADRLKAMKPACDTSAGGAVTALKHDEAAERARAKNAANPVEECKAAEQALV